MIKDSNRQRRLLMMAFFLGCSLIGFAAFIEPPLLQSDKRIGPEHVKAFDALPAHSVATISLRGGDAGYALDSSDIIDRKRLTLRVTSLCMSACAESILPAAAKLILGPEAIIGFHGNSMVYRDLSGFDPGPCNASNNQRHEALLQRKGLNVDFWKEQHKRLDFGDFRYLADRGGPRAECPHVNMSMRARMWLPTSQQLRELYGLKFDGRICADNPTCLQRRLARVFRKGDLVIVGDTPTRVQ
jgi:hypothetical protein